MAATYRDSLPLYDPTPNGPHLRSSTASSSSDHSGGTRPKWVFTALILLLGIAASAAFLALGITATNRQSDILFQRDANDISLSIESAWRDYEIFGLWIHETCQKSYQINYEIQPDVDIARHLGYCSRNDFLKLYYHILSVGLDFQSVQLVVNVTDDLRQDFEDEAALYYRETYPQVNYQGITGLDENSTIHRRERRPYYLPVHYVQPVAGNEEAIELDKQTLRSAFTSFQAAVSMWKPYLSGRMKLVQEKDPDAYGIILAHPGLPPNVDEVVETRAVAQVIISVPSFLRHALNRVSLNKRVYLYDATASETTPEFLGGAEVKCMVKGKDCLAVLMETDINEIDRSQSARYFESTFDVANRRWTVVIVSDDYDSQVIFVILGGIILFSSGALFALWFYTHISRVQRLQQLKSEAEADKAENARLQVIKERELNEFMAHELRNPLASAISALSFVSAGVYNNVAGDAARKSILDDVRIMEASLQWTNDLLRNMLDLHRSTENFTLDVSPVDIYHDVFQAVASTLSLRGAEVEVIVECPRNLTVESDRMRLKQIILNLSANALKFVERGFVRLHARVVAGSVELSVADSGPGVPLHKRNRLFAKYQESLDSLNQGTGIGLNISKNLSELLGADLWLDENFDSGIQGTPGTRFVLSLNKPPFDVETAKSSLDPSEENSDRTGSESSEDGTITTLPDSLSILIVDDDNLIRKMLRRALLRICPDWAIQEACNGETALRLVESQDFDLIFLDQYMASIDKQLLGTETAQALRSKGVSSVICGLSANDMETQFLRAGANAFLFKPFPCEKSALSESLQKILAEKQADVWRSVSFANI